MCVPLKRVFEFYFANGKFNAIILKKILKDTFGTRLPAVSGPAGDSFNLPGMKYAVTATTISDAALCLISNYHGEDKQGENSSRWYLPVFLIRNQG
jgi:hypothetical protein